MVRVLAMAVIAPPFILVHLGFRALGRWSPMPRHFLRAIGWLAGLRIRIVGSPRRAPVLFVSNHVSWLDILALGGTAGSAFVSKAEVRDVALVGWLADQNHTLYVERAARGAVREQTDALRQKLDGRHPITLFPEGTTGDGAPLLPFRASLFQAVLPPPPGLVAQPVWLDYAGVHDIAWVGAEPALDNARRVLGRQRPVDLAIHFLDPIDPALATDRKALAHATRSAIAAAMATRGCDRTPGVLADEP